MIAVLQARLGSTRLPGKAFFTFFGQNMVERSIAIARAVRMVERVVLATGDDPLNMALEKSAVGAGAQFMVGSEQNVLKRFCDAIADYEGQYLLRMTCDNYLVQPEVVETLYEAALRENADYAYIAPLSHFSGEIVRCSALRECLQGKPSAEALEHVTWDIRRNSDYRIVTLPPDTCGIRHENAITLDTMDDLIKMKMLEQSEEALSTLRCTREITRIFGKP